MKIVVTGANGFLGKNLCLILKETKQHDVIEVTRDTPTDQFLLHIKKMQISYIIWQELIDQRLLKNFKLEM